MNDEKTVEKNDENITDSGEINNPEKGEPNGKKPGKKLQHELESLQSALAEEKEKYLRLAAEYDNYRKRSAKEKSDAYTEAYADAVKAFLPLADSLDHALEFSPEDEGIKALHKQFADSCAKIGVTAIESDGKQFDPELHNAIMHEEDPEQGENTVVQTFCKGYELNGRVIRHAMVKVVN